MNAPSPSLNAAGREVSRRLGVHVLDLECMLRGFAPSQYLDSDDVTAKGGIMLEVANLMLNVQQ